MKFENWKEKTLPGNITILRTVQCWVWIGFRQCLLRASELPQTSLSNIIRHIDSRVQCKSKQSACRWSCCIRILSVRHVNKHAIPSTRHIYCHCMLVSSFKVFKSMNAPCFGCQTKNGGKNIDYNVMITLQRESASCWETHDLLFDILTVSHLI